LVFMANSYTVSKRSEGSRNNALYWGAEQMLFFLNNGTLVIYRFGRVAPA